MFRTKVDVARGSARSEEVPGAAGNTPRHDWSLSEIRAIHEQPLLELVFRAATVHRQYHDPREVQVCRLVSVKTGGCPEDCGYCAQSAHYETGVESEPMLGLDAVLAMARTARENGISRVCLGAAWREARDDEAFERVLEMVREVTDLGMEVCCTLGMLTADQARRLEAAGLFAYNHNLDTSERHYRTIITTREYRDRLETLARLRETRVTVCCGGIIGLGESIEDRLALLQTLAGLRPHPESVPINLLSTVAGTPLADQPEASFDEALRMIATARIMMPRSVVRLSAGRARFSEAEQALCLLAGANSIFSSETQTMLTRAVPSPDYERDRAMLNRLGLRMRAPYKGGVHEPDPADELAAATL